MKFPVRKGFWDKFPGSGAATATDFVLPWGYPISMIIIEVAAAIPENKISMFVDNDLAQDAKPADNTAKFPKKKIITDIIIAPTKVSPNTHSQDYLNQDEADTNMEYDRLLVEISVSRPVSYSICKVANTKLPQYTHFQDYLSQNSSINEPTEEAGHEQGDGGADAEDQCIEGGEVKT